MTAKKYRLETVLDLRARAKDEAARTLAIKLRLLEEAEAELSRRQRSLQDCYNRQNQTRLKLNGELNKGVTNRDLLGYKNYLSDLRALEEELQNAVDKQIRAVAEAENEIEKARLNLVESAKQLKAIEIHKENWQTTEKISRERRAAKISDEIGAILHGRKKFE